LTWINDAMAAAGTVQRPGRRQPALRPLRAARVPVPSLTQVNGRHARGWDGRCIPRTKRQAMIRDILFPVTGTSGEENAIAGAIALASEYNAHLSLVVPLSVPPPVAGPWGASDLVLDEMLTLVSGEAEARATQLRNRLSNESISWEVRIANAGFSDPAHVLARHARYADLSVMATAKPGANDGAVVRAFFSAMLFESGRPVLVIPAAPPILPIRRTVLAWRPTRESVRALNDALFLLGSGSSFDAVTINEPGMGERADIEIGTHLARHGLQVNAASVSSAGETVAAALLRHASETDAQLLVAGGYGHSRLREWMLGGTTRELLETARVPILFSH
jgi:nucleotide-binding universal stress UspA family protein